MTLNDELVEIEMEERVLVRKMKKLLDEEAERTGGKRCNGCNLVKPKDAFGNNKSKRDGLMPRCRECHNRNVKVSRRRDRVMKSMGDEFGVKLVTGVTVKDCKFEVDGNGNVPREHWLYNGELQVCSCCGAMSKKKVNG